MNDADRAVIARIGGNEYRRRLERRANELRNGKYSASAAEFDRWVRQDAESLAAGESYQYGQYTQPYRSDTYQSPAVFHGLQHVMSRRDYTVKLPEAAFDWPVYRAALTDPFTDRHMAACDYIGTYGEDDDE